MAGFINLVQTNDKALDDVSKRVEVIEENYITKSVDNLEKYYSKDEVYNKEELDTKLSSVYNYKGAVERFSDLPSGASVGDVYNVGEEFENIPAGTNFAWNGVSWDALGGAVDLSAYVEKSTTIAGIDLANSITTVELLEALNVQSGAQANKIESISINGLEIAIYDKNVNLPIPTKTGSLENDAGFVKQADIDEATADLASQESLTAVALQVAELSAQVGDIGTLLDTINGEVV